MSKDDVDAESESKAETETSFWETKPTTQEEVDFLIRSINDISNYTFLPEKKKPIAPNLPPSMTIPKQLKLIQNFINEFEYNHTGKMYFTPRKRGTS